jgi:hypothetical protein
MTNEYARRTEMQIEIDTIIQIIEKIDNRLKNNRNRDYFSIISSIAKVDLKSKCVLLCPNYVISLNSNANNFVTQRIELHTVSTRLSRHSAHHLVNAVPFF